ncbi:MAG: putative 8-amino-7-oxononanoate synthase/2-amino-3-ketobutyrate coenzyme A ligase [Rhodospirillaceae bacterium]|nr:MAG: putative 8-amino-7-oxononanoate synthase/2-amino-3-ketobutyrate coenzyme A ligase [Rhodospirillaceae bacterium]
MSIAPALRSSVPHTLAMDHLNQKAQEFLERLDARHVRRSLQSLCPGPGNIVWRGGRALVNFSSNNTLGLAGHPRLIERASRWAGAYGVGATASRLVCGTLPLHEQIEEKLAAFKGTETALILNSGFQANSSLLPALLDPEFLGAEPVVLVDRLIHASLHQGCAAARVHPIRFRHNDLDHLETLLRKHAGVGRQPFIMTESVFSMDGDRAALAPLATLAERFGAVFYVDEAHATGLFGPRGEGLVAAEAPGRVEVIMGTFSKALGGFGAYVACSRRLRDYLINRCAGFLYSTALPPPVLGAMDAALDLVPSLGAERAHVHVLAARLRGALTAAGLSVAGSSTHIVPAILGDEAATLAAVRILAEEHGVLTIAIRPPTVPPMTSRLRFSLNALHDEAAIGRLLAAAPVLSTMARPAVMRQRAVS